MLKNRQENKKRENGLYQICHLDEAFEARVLLDVESVELDSIGPWMRVFGLKKVLDLVIIDVQS